jgi:hypothetical protein
MNTDETVTTRIVLEATLALKNLADLSNATTSFKNKIELARQAVKSFATETGMKFGDAKKVLSDLDAQYSGTATSSTVFGGAGQAAWDKVGESATKNSNKVSIASRAMTIAIGMLIHQGINLLINAFQKMFTMAISGLRELETATYNLVNAERALSEQGVDITPKGLDETIKKLQILDPLLSKTQATEVVSRAASLVAPNVGFNAEEIDQFARSVAVLAVKNRGLGKSFEEVESQISNAFLSGRVSVGINQLGVKITDQIVKDEALRLGLVKTADEFDRLTGKMEANIKARAMLSVLAQATNKEQAHLPEFFKTADAKFGIFQARLSDFFTKFGTLAAPILIKVFDLLIEGLEKGLEWLNKNSDALTLWADVMGNVVVITAKVVGWIIKLGTAFGYVSIGINKAVGNLQKLIDKTPFLKKLVELLGFKGIGDAADTPTGSPNPPPFAKENDNSKMVDAQKEAEDKLTEIMKDARDKRLDIEREYQQKLQDIALNNSQKLQDIALNTSRKQEDALADYNKKIEDINSDATKSAQEARQDAQKSNIEKERAYQQELKDLQQQFLLDLEEALHERDARAILRLIRQHEIDKQKLEEKRKLEAEQSKRELIEKLKSIEEERKAKIEAAKKEYADKLKEIELARKRELQDAAIANQRALADARIAHNRQLAEQREYLQRKLRDLAEAIAAEYNLTSAGIAAINALIGSATGSTSSTGSLYTSATPVVSPTWAAAGMYGTGGLAEGGTFLATRPTTLNVAENRPEIISAAPLGRPGADVNKMFSNASMGGGASGGQVEIGLTLSPDLESRIIRNTLDKTAEVVVKVNRSKV